jgi:hypothetical protein
VGRCGWGSPINNYLLLVRPSLAIADHITQATRNNVQIMKHRTIDIDVVNRLVQGPYLTKYHAGEMREEPYH